MPPALWSSRFYMATRREYVSNYVVKLYLYPLTRQTLRCRLRRASYRISYTWHIWTWVRMPWLCMFLLIQSIFFQRTSRVGLYILRYDKSSYLGIKNNWVGGIITFISPWSSDWWVYYGFFEPFFFLEMITFRTQGPPILGALLSGDFVWWRPAVVSGVSFFHLEVLL